MPRFVTGLLVLARIGLFHNTLGLGSAGDSIEQAISNGQPPAAASSVLPVLGRAQTTSIAALRDSVIILNF